MELFICSFCGSERHNKNSWFNHERTCSENKNRNYKNGMTGKKGSNQYLKCQKLNLPKPKYDTSNRPKPIWMQQDREVWLQSIKGNGGYRANAGNSKKFRVKDSFGKDVVLQSTYELLCSQILNEIGVLWVRPTYLKYDNKKYFPDFYLIEHDIYLDPKNSYRANLDNEKIQKVILQNGVNLFVVLKENLTKQWFCNLIGKIED